MGVASSTDPALAEGSPTGGPVVSEEALNAALARLGYDGFRSGQRRAVETLLRDRRLLFVAPTGGGKSLVYQLTACLLSGTTVVVSPLIALMADQVMALERRGIPATFLASTLPPDEMGRRIAGFARVLRRGADEDVVSAA